MKSRRFVRTRLWVEELERRVVLSTTPSLFHQVANATLATQSTNWSGYAALPTTGAVTMVSGSWVVPAVTGTSTAYSSFWVGIDGYNSNTVEQIGTDSDIQNGVPTYYAWYEMYPNPSFSAPLELSGKTIAVSPGNTIDASVTYAAKTSTYTLTLTDATTGASFTTSEKLAGAQNSSAEWIAEAPSSNSGELPLANFGSVTFSKASATINGTTGAIDNPAWQNASINMVSGRNNSVIASTGPLTDSATTPATSSFTVAYSTPSTGGSGNGGGSGGSGHHHGWGYGSGFGGWGWRGPNGETLPIISVGAAMPGTETATGVGMPPGPGSTPLAAFAVPTASIPLSAAQLNAPALAPVLAAMSLNGPRISTAVEADELIDDAELMSVWLPAGVAFRGNGGSLTEIAAAQRSQPAFVTDGAPMQVIMGDQPGDFFAIPVPASTPLPTPEQHSGPDGTIGRAFSKLLWLIGAAGMVARAALVEKLRSNDTRDQGQR